MTTANHTTSININTITSTLNDSTTVTVTVKRLTTTPTVVVAPSQIKTVPDAGVNTGVAAGVAVGVVALIICCLLFLHYLRKTGRLKCLKRRPSFRNFSTNSSQHPYTEYKNEYEHVDVHSRQQEDVPVDADADDGFFMDEVFEKSDFEDENTITSNRQLVSSPKPEDTAEVLLTLDKDLFSEVDLKFSRDGLH